MLFARDRLKQKNKKDWKLKDGMIYSANTNKKGSMSITQWEDVEGMSEKEEGVKKYKLVGTK